MQRHLGYPPVPRLEPPDPLPSLIPQLQRRMETFESRLKLIEEEQRGGLDITKFYGKGQIPSHLSSRDSSRRHVAASSQSDVLKVWQESSSYKRKAFVGF